MKCKHENTPVDPAMIREIVYTHAGRLIAQRQCSICNQTLEQSRPLSKDEAGLDVQDILIFYDWDQGTWEPISQRAAYEAQQLARVTPPVEPPAEEAPPA